MLIVGNDNDKNTLVINSILSMGLAWPPYPYSSQLNY